MQIMNLGSVISRDVLLKQNYHKLSFQFLLVYNGYMLAV